MAKVVNDTSIMEAMLLRVWRYPAGDELTSAEIGAARSIDQSTAHSANTEIRSYRFVQSLRYSSAMPSAHSDSFATNCRAAVPRRRAQP
jgi:hypothetical protein